MERVLIIASGELDDITAGRLKGWRESLVAVDGGADHCRALGLTPDVVVGDLDSLSPETLAAFRELGVPFERHPAAKAETDLELAAFRAVEQGARHLVLAGVLGGRLDMTLANLLLLAHPRLEPARVEVWHQRSTAWLLRPPGGEFSGEPGDTLSLVPLQGSAEGIVTEGLVYPLRDEALHLGQGRGVSNVLAEAGAAVRLRSGLLLAVLTPGRA